METEYVTHQTTCKFCKSPLQIKIDSRYDELGDPLKLMGMATCNPCADRRERRRKLSETIGHTMNRWLAMKKADREENEEDFRKTFRILLNGYCEVCAMLQGRAEHVYDSSMVEAFIALADFEPEPGQRKNDEVMRRASCVLARCWELNCREQEFAF